MAQLNKRLKKLLKTSTHFMILGARGEGKTSLGMFLLELHHKYTDRPIFIYNFPQPSLLPKWIKNITKLDNLPENAIVCCDEAGIDFDQYSYAKKTNIYLRNLLITARHKNQSYIFISITTSFINKNFIYLIDAYFLKNPTVYQREEERKIIRWMYNQINEDIAVNNFYFNDAQIKNLKGSFKKPKWFTQELSKAYNQFEAEEIK
jgi:hypothetical protein